MLHRPATTSSSGTPTGSVHGSLHEHLPTVSVCVPTSQKSVADQLSDCLAHILASTYPKLEVIVHHELLHDQPDVVKHYATKGVRFITQDDTQTDRKQHLLNEASGNLVFFVDPDTQLEPETIGDMVRGFLNPITDSIIDSTTAA